MLAIAALLTAGVRESARTNTVMVVTKLAILLFFIVVGFSAFHGDHFTPFQPHGFSGTMDAAALIFFAYIGFDAVSTSGEEARNPGTPAQGDHRLAADRDSWSTSSSRSPRSAWRRPTSSPAPTRR